MSQGEPHSSVDGPPDMTDVQVSSRDPEQMRRRLETWLSTRLGAAAQPQVPEIGATSANGMSSDTLLFRATWTDGDAERSEALVARVAPDMRDIPVFATYDLGRQFEVIRLKFAKIHAAIHRGPPASDLG